MKTTKQLDLKGLYCPMPMVKTSQALELLTAGEILEVIVTDKTSCRDLPRWIESSGNTLLEIKSNEGISQLFIQKN